jgi:hypothetical protein
MRPTGRTISICVRVTPELKEKMNSIQDTENFKLSEWFEKRFKKDFCGGDIIELETEKKKALKAIEEIDKKINSLKLKKESEARLNLSTEEVRQLTIACDPNDSIKRQYGIFCVVVKRKYSFDEFKELKKKYVYQG